MGDIDSATAPPFDPVPNDRATVLDPAWLATALDGIGDRDRVVSVDEVGETRTIAQKLRFRVTVEGDDGVTRTDAYCVKAHFDEEGPGSLGPEANYYRTLDPWLRVRTPAIAYSAFDESTGRGLIVMEDVIANGGRFLDAHQPYSVDTTRDSLGQLAQLHAATWGNPRPSGCDWLMPKIALMADRYPAEALQGWLDDGRGPDVAPELRDAGLLLDAMRATAALPETCVLHGDTHSGNVYLDAQGRACWLDWQVVQPGHWSVDVAYHLSTVLDVETRRTQEEDLLRYYLEVLAAAGVDAPSFDAAWDAYRGGFTHGFFLWTITTVSSRAVVLIHFPRIATAMTDHETYRRLGVV
jgi:hypothetical protein